MSAGMTPEELHLPGGAWPKDTQLSALFGSERRAPSSARTQGGLRPVSTVCRERHSDSTFLASACASTVHWMARPQTPSPMIGNSAARGPTKSASAVARRMLTSAAAEPKGSAREAVDASCAQASARAWTRMHRMKNTSAMASCRAEANCTNTISMASVAHIKVRRWGKCAGMSNPKKSGATHQFLIVTTPEEGISPSTACIAASICLCALRWRSTALMQARAATTAKGAPRRRRAGGRPPWTMKGTTEAIVAQAPTATYIGTPARIVVARPIRASASAIRIVMSAVSLFAMATATFPERSCQIVSKLTPPTSKGIMRLVTALPPNTGATTLPTVIAPAGRSKGWATTGTPILMKSLTSFLKLMMTSLSTLIW
mmetsp:Transcript_26841/g.67595  ORF Transcript_26841/g.67595 Transcript_26841/m.67595 type:complete len:373 (+) Transcript_26841:1344-2462(+)